MASGTIITLYRANVNAETVSLEVYQKYIDAAAKRHSADSMLIKHLKNGDKIFYPSYMAFKLADNQPLVHVSNFNGDRYSKPSQNEVKYVDHIGEVNFNSMFTSLPEFWNLNAYVPEMESHSISVIEARKISKAIHYLKDGVHHLKVANIIEKYAQQDNEFFKPIAEMLPSYSFPKEFKKGEADLVEEEELNQIVLQELVTMVDYFLLLVNEQETWELTKYYLYDLVITKW